MADDGSTIISTTSTTVGGGGRITTSSSTVGRHSADGDVDDGVDAGGESTAAVPDTDVDRAGRSIGGRRRMPPYNILIIDLFSFRPGVYLGLRRRSR